MIRLADEDHKEKEAFGKRNAIESWRVSGGIGKLDQSMGCVKLS